MAISKGYISFLCVVLCWTIYKFINFDKNLLHYSKLDSRPVVFGEDFCKYIYKDEVKLNSGQVEKFLNIFTSMNIIHAQIGEKKIILKNLFSENSFESIQKDFDNKFNDKLLQSPSAVEIMKLYIHSLIRHKDGTALLSKIRLCPYSSRITTENFFKKIINPPIQISDYFHLWTIIKCNAEPLILKMLQPPNWPVPVFYGSCGHLIAVEDCGVMLTHFHSSPWVIRANLSYQILQVAFQFTFDDSDFAFYFTDMSPDNFAVNDEGRLKMIDLDHVIIVDKKAVFEEEKQPRWNYNHSSKHYPCEDGIIFEADEICSYKLSDHNIYAVCKEILSSSSLMPGGLLHNPPPEFPQMEHFNSLITDCVEAHARFETAQKILSLLKDALL